jgi:hypothetical protein
LQDYDLQSSKPYRYYTLGTIGEKPPYVAHVEFLGAQVDSVASQPPTPLPVFSPLEKERKDTRMVRYCGSILRKTEDTLNAIDGNMETYSKSRKIVFDFTSPVKALRVRFAPRNANNIVNPGDTYCLYYYDEGWQEHSRQVAEGNYLVFKNVPKGTLYWLSDETRGREELPFRYVHGRQVFIDNYQPGRIE